jgi:Domain of unknown function (DUF4116)
MSNIRPRLDKILALHGQALLEAVDQREPVQLETSCESPEAQLLAHDLISRFADSDPTNGKSRTQWLVKTYIKDEHFKLEDLGRVDAALSAFERFKQKLPIEQRELSRLKSLRELEALVDPFVKTEARARLERDLSSATGRELRRLEEMKARDESIIIQSDFCDFELKSQASRGEEAGLPTIAVPLTEFASCWWGRGTKWCTAAEKNDMLVKYHKDAPLIVVVCSDGEKFQLHVSKNDVQFRDSMDNVVKKKLVRARWAEFQSLLHWAIEQNGWTLKFIPEEHRTPELCRIAVEQNGWALSCISEEQRTPELCRLAVEQDGQALSVVPAQLKKPELCGLAVRQNGLALLDVPEDHKTPELCILAVEQNGQALEHVPGQHRTPELCCIAIEQNGFALGFIPKEQRTPELCRMAVEQEGRALLYVIHNYKTPQLCSLAIKQNGEALQFVPAKLKKLELCRIAIEQNGMALKFVPHDLKSSSSKRPRLKCVLEVSSNHWQDDRILEIYRFAVQQDGMALEYTPEEQRTSDLCCLAIEQNGDALQFVPEKLRTRELMALIPPVKPEWSLDILKGLGYQSQNVFDSLNQDNL